MLGVGVGSTVVGCLLGIAGVTLASPSPQQAAAARQAPTLPAPVATVKKQVIARYVQGACTLSAVEVEAKAPAASAEERLVVTALPLPVGSDVKSGRVIAAVSGRSLIAFRTTMPFYRDLMEGDSGPDVKALEDGLVADGLLAKADGRFDQATAAVIARLNSAAGLESATIRWRTAVAVPPGSRISRIAVAVGQVVAANATLVKLTAGADRAICQVPETANVSVGDKVTVTNATKSVDAIVASVAPVPDVPGQTAVTVTSSSGLEGGAELQVLAGPATEAVLSVPAGALATDASGKTSVRKVSDNKTTDVEVSLGATAGGWVEVAGEGLAEGDSVELRTS